MSEPEHNPYRAGLPVFDPRRNLELHLAGALLRADGYHPQVRPVSHRPRSTQMLAMQLIWLLLALVASAAVVLPETETSGRLVLPVAVGVLLFDLALVAAPMLTVWGRWRADRGRPGLLLGWSCGCAALTAFVLLAGTARMALRWPGLGTAAELSTTLTQLVALLFELLFVVVCVETARRVDR